MYNIALLHKMIHPAYNLFLAIYLAHLLTDFVFQTTRIVSNKHRGEWRGEPQLHQLPNHAWTVRTHALVVCPAELQHGYVSQQVDSGLQRDEREIASRVPECVQPCLVEWHD